MKPANTTNPVPMRFVEHLNNGEKVVTYFQILELDKQYYYVYNDVNHGPYREFDEAVRAATSDLIPVSG